LVRVLSSCRLFTIVIRITDIEFSSFDQLSDEAINAEGLPAHLTSTQKRVLLRRIMYSCHNGHKGFDDAAVVFRIRFEKVWKYQNVMTFCISKPFAALV
jgi:hypothetical protein